MPPAADAPAAPPSAPATAPPSPATPAATSSVATEAAAATTEAKPEPPIEPQRILLLPMTGPLVVHLQLVVDGEPQARVVERRLDEAEKIVRGDAASYPAWDALLAKAEFTSGLLGNPSPDEISNRDRMNNPYDYNRDTYLQREELAGLLARDAGRGRPFWTTWMADRGLRERSGSALFALLDQDEDGVISATEGAAAAVRLRSRDGDDNDAITIAELRPPESPRATMRYRDEPAAVRGFELRKSELDAIHYSLGDLYDSGNGLDAQCFALTPELFAALDADRSGQVELSEVAGLLTAPPSVVVKVSFGRSTDRAEPPRMELVSRAEGLKAAGVAVEQSAGRLDFKLPGAKVTLYALDRVNGSGRAAAASTEFARLDADKNSHLDAKELAADGVLASMPLADVDANQDAQLTLEEFTQAIVTRPTYGEAQVQALLAETADPLFDWLDQRTDGRLTSRELAGATARLEELDANGDGMLGPNEIPDRVSCAIARGMGDMMGNRANRYMPMPAAESPTASATLRWHAAMDRNGDGEISRREFLGTPQQFAQMDANGDGFIGSDEVRADKAAEEKAPTAGDASDNPPAESK
ncbi:MAG: hypothetical protein AB7O59_22230 [Pirellulales bacterium]